jgi:disulfide oxidoreductase YuzD
MHDQTYLYAKVANFNENSNDDRLVLLNKYNQDETIFKLVEVENL